MAANVSLSNFCDVGHLMPLWRRYPWLLRTAALLLAAVAVLLPNVWAPQAIARLEDGLSDLVWRLNASEAQERRVVLVDIDEKSLSELGPWPWPRATIAELSERLQRSGVRVQAFDIAFPDPKVGDTALSQAWQGTRPVVAQVFSLDPSVTAAVGQVLSPLEAQGCPRFAPSSHGYYGLAPALAAAQPTLGHITPRVASDGVVRHIPVLVCHQGRAYASLALATLWRAAQSESIPLPAVDWQPKGDQAGALFALGLHPYAWLASASLPGLAVPIDANGNLRVPYTLQRRAFTSISAVDVLKGSVDARVLNGALVIVGATAFGIGDTISTPLGAVASGLEVHAQTLVGLLDGVVPYTPMAWPVWQFMLMVLLSGVLLLSAVRSGGVPAKRLPLVGLALSGLMLVLLLTVSVRASLWLPWWPTVAFALLASLVLATAEHALVRAQRERLTAHLGAYLPAPVAKRLMSSEPSGLLQLEQRAVTVMVADVRNFGAFATYAKPDEVAALLHTFCCLSVEIVEKHGGVVENVVGSSMTALWTDLPGQPPSGMRAVAAAQELCRASRPLLASSGPVSEVSPLQPLALGVGLESGLAIVGSFGPERRRAHAALGEPVSVANRIQQMTADLSMPIVLGPHLAAALPADALEPLGEYLLEGLAKHCALYAPTGWGELAPVDLNWAQTAIGQAEASDDGVAWSGWGKPQKTGLFSGQPRLRAYLLRRRSA